MKKLLILALATCSSSMLLAQAKSYSKLPSGIEYNIVKDAPGTETAVNGSYITMHIRTTLNDSILFDSYKFNNNEPVPAQVTSPTYAGDIMEALPLLTAGDSAVFRVPCDSIFRNGGLPPYAKSGDKVMFQVNMVSVKSKEQFEKEKAEEARKQFEIDEKLIKDFAQKNKLKLTKTASGLYYAITKKGTGENAKPGQTVTMNYTGKLLDGTVFDSNVDPKFGHVQPFDFNLGAGQVIKGWDEGIALLNKGAKAMLVIPAPLAYGAQSMPGGPNNPKGIPANSVLVFDVEMVEAK